MENIVYLSVASAPVDAQLLAEADKLTNQIGPNPYSKFLRDHGKRPDPAAAAVIGQVLGIRVRASNGTLQPVKHRVKSASTAASAREAVGDADVSRLLDAVEKLAKIVNSPHFIVSRMTPGERLLFSKLSSPALESLQRFAWSFPPDVQVELVETADPDAGGNRPRRLQVVSGTAFVD